MKFNRDSNHHRINLDENMLKSAQLNKKAHLELGIEGETRIMNILFGHLILISILNTDFLDGDIVSYLFNENRNLIEFNPEQGLCQLNIKSNLLNSTIS